MNIQTRSARRKLLSQTSALKKDQQLEMMLDGFESVRQFLKTHKEFLESLEVSLRQIFVISADNVVKLKNIESQMNDTLIVKEIFDDILTKINEFK